MRFSIICATFNRASLIKNAIGSVISQSYSNWEMIIVDDGSIDNTESIVKEFLSDNIKYIKLNRNYGVGYARNKGINESSGEWIIVLDSDNKLYDDSLLLISLILKKYPTIDFHNFIVVDNNNNFLSNSISKSLIIEFKDWIKSPPKGEFHSVIRKKHLIKIPFLININGGEHITWNLIVNDVQRAAYHPIISEIYDNKSQDRLSVREKNINRIMNVHIQDMKTCWYFYFKYSKKKLIILFIKILIYKIYSIYLNKK